ncbi:AAA family ATPase [Turicibacter sp. GALT-G1]|uniref:AAA family ATPase n=1 Tax=Turicibacter sp. GALT-G1 TaxID=2951140 RepID=UPI0021D4CF9E|nr:AAA family ATPase [Turicibacter sp. GALT-G1]MCU7206946.1 AAA family ATPase [Turicibacter sp. GALT-G1]
MFLKYIKLKDFRQYTGTQEIQLSSPILGEDDKNVTIILGQNTAGKTTLLQAFKWCFYGKTDFKKENLLNSDKVNNMKPGDHDDVEVEICLIHADMEYIIYRKQTYYITSTGKLSKEASEVDVTFKDKDGQTISVKQGHIGDAINEILPEDLSSYFFFDTERIGSISEKSDVSNAVKGLLGLTVLANAMEHLNKGEKSSVIGQLKSSYDDKGNEAIEVIKTQLHEKIDEKEKLEEEIEKYKAEKKRNLDIKEDLNEKLISLKSVAEDQDKKNKLEISLDNTRKKQQEKQNQFKVKYNKSILSIVAAPLIKEVNKLLHDTEVDDKGVIDITSRTIDEILKRQKCICGTEFCQGDEHYLALVHEKSFVPPESLGTSISKFKLEMNNWEGNALSASEDLNSLFENIQDLSENIGDFQSEINFLGKKIYGKEDAKKYQEQMTKVEAIISDYEDRIDEANQRLGILGNDIEKLKKDYDSLVEIKGKNIQIATYIKYAEEIYNTIYRTYSKKERLIRDALEKKVNDIFTQMYHGKRYLTIDEKYQVTLYNAGGSVSTEASTGLETVKNFAFITGLVALAKERIINESDDSLNLESEAYPLVMDAPFSNADETHVKNIAKLVPEVAEQVLIFVMEKDWQHAKIVMGDKVNKKYYLDKQSETITFIKECE